jgi:hypothetical protein
MTVTLEPPRPPSPFTIRWTRMIVVALLLAAIGVVIVDFTKPERRFRTAETTASVQVRVVRNAAPTVESLERRILSNDELQDLWDDFFAKEAGSDQARRAAELVEWRHRLRVEVDTGPIGDLRSIRIVWQGLEDLDMGAAIVESLARRYADEVSADRWYGSVDRLRIQVREIEAAAKEVGAARQRQASSNAPTPDIAHTASFEPVPDDRLNAPLLIAPNADGAVPAAIEKPKPKNVVFPPSPASMAVRGSIDPSRRLATATANLRREMDDLLLPREAEFPVVTLDRIGLNVAHLRPLWYLGVGLVSLLAALAISVSRVAFVATASSPAPPVEVAGDPIEPLPSVHPIHIASETEEPTVAIDPLFHTAAEVESRLAAPVLAIVSRRTSQSEPAVARPLRRAA